MQNAHKISFHIQAKLSPNATQIEQKLYIHVLMTWLNII